MTPAEREIAEEAAEQELDRIGYAGDAKTMRLMRAAQDEQAERGVGPLARHRRMMKRLGPPSRHRWPRLTTAWNDEPTQEWKDALAKDGKR